MNNYQIGARPCLYVLENTSTSIKEIIVFLLDFMVAFFLFVFLLPWFCMFLVYRIGFKNTIKLFKRVDREYKRKKYTKF